MIPIFQFKRKPKEDIFEFCKNYSHIYYCEIIIHPDGMIEQICPSHIECLKSIYDEIYGYGSADNVSIQDYSIEFFIENTGCVAVWYNFYLESNIITERQRQTLKGLIDNKKVGFQINKDKV